MASRQVRAPAAGSATELSAVDGLAQLSFLIQKALVRRAGEHGLSMIQTRLLGVLRDRKPTMNQLATLLELDKSSVTGLIDRAQRRGLVTRAPSATDGRAVVVALTDAGRSCANDVAARFESDVAQLLDTLSASDSATLSTTVSRLLVAHAAAHGVDLFAGVAAPPRGRDTRPAGRPTTAKTR